MDAVKLDATPTEVPYEIKIGGVVRIFKLREASEAAASRYENEKLKTIRMAEKVDGTKSGTVDGLSDTESLLVSLCLFEMVGDSEKSVDQSFVKSLPHRVSKVLFENAEEISHLETEETEQEILKKIKALNEKLVKKRTGTSKEEALKN